jgi:hypothetical protein
VGHPPPPQCRHWGGRQARACGPGQLAAPTRGAQGEATLEHPLGRVGGPGGATPPAACSAAPAATWRRECQPVVSPPGVGVLPMHRPLRLGSRRAALRDRASAVPQRQPHREGNQQGWRVSVPTGLRRKQQRRRRQAGNSSCRQDRQVQQTAGQLLHLVVQVVCQMQQLELQQG